MRVAVLADMASVHTPRWCEALIARGLEVRCFSLEDFDIEAPYGQYIPPRLDKQILRYISSFDKVGRAVAEFDPDVINPVHFPNYGLISWLMRTDKPVYLVGWGSDILHAAEKTPVHKWLTNKLVHRADAINVDAEIMRTFLIDRYGYPGSKVDLITWGLPEAWYEEPLPPAPPEGPPWHIMCHRRLDYDMDPIKMLEGFQQSLNRGLDAILHIKGHGPWERKVKDWVTAQALDDRVQYIPWLDYDDLRHYLAKGHVYANTAWVDSTSVSILEVMSQGLLPVTTDIPANREWVIHDYNGLCFHPRSAEDLATCLIHACNDRELRERARPVNRFIVENKARWEVHMDTVAEAIRKLAR